MPGDDQYGPYLPASVCCRSRVDLCSDCRNECPVRFFLKGPSNSWSLCQTSIVFASRLGDSDVGLEVGSLQVAVVKSLSSAHFH